MLFDIYKTYLKKRYILLNFYSKAVILTERSTDPMEQRWNPQKPKKKNLLLNDLWGWRYLWLSWSSMTALLESCVVNHAPASFVRPACNMAPMLKGQFGELGCARAPRIWRTFKGPPTMSQCYFIKSFARSCQVWES